MVEVVLKTSGGERVAANLSRLAHRLKDTAVPNRAIATQLYSWTLNNFDRQGASVGGWPPLAARTIAHKKKIGKERMLVISGHLRASLLPFSDARRAGVGSEVPYAKDHQEGRERLPRRELLPPERVVLETGLKVYGFYVEEATREAA